MSVKIISVRSAILAAVLAATLCGCSPTGPGALLKGKKLLDRGDYTGAVAEFRTATTLLTTNATAWNYYGVALQGAGQPTDAINAYQKALELDRDLIEARLNLGTLFMQQDKPADAKTEFTTYTLRRPNDSQGWLKLGSAQLKLKETIAAERSFSAVLALKPNEAEAYNGLGLARIQRNKPSEAAQFFTAAVRMKPGFASALLNLATVYDQYLHNDKAALQCYHLYLSLKPKPANWDEVNALVNNLEQSISLGSSAPASTPDTVTTVPPPVVRPNQQAPPPTTVAEAKPQPKPQPKPEPQTAPVRVLQSPRARAEESPKPVVRQSTTPVQPAAPPPTQVVRVAPEPHIVTHPITTSTVRPAQPVAQPAPIDNYEYAQSGVTPLPNSSGVSASQTAKTTVRQQPITILAPAPINFPRYNYVAPTRLAAGDRRAASGAFAQARTAEQEGKWTLALSAYREAASLDPSWFEAQYNAGVIAQRMQNFPSALSSYENALVLRPDSLDARYNFALALKSAGYVPDAANELKKLLKDHPDDVRAHLALANICAQLLHDPVQARQQYQKVLELDPGNARAADIQMWLKTNPS